ncbi:unnamed protein product [Boreogadus saida]
MDLLVTVNPSPGVLSSETESTQWTHYTEQRCIQLEQELPQTLSSAGRMLPLCRGHCARAGQCGPRSVDQSGNECD